MNNNTTMTPERTLINYLARYNSDGYESPSQLELGLLLCFADNVKKTRLSKKVIEDYVGIPIDNDTLNDIVIKLTSIVYVSIESDASMITRESTNLFSRYELITKKEKNYLRLVNTSEPRISKLFERLADDTSYLQQLVLPSARIKMYEEQFWNQVG